MSINGKVCLVVLTVVGFLGVSGQGIRAQLLTVTPHDLLPEQKIVVEGEAMPQWKGLWDEARKKALQGDFDAALRLYGDLLLVKSNLNEARWELARLMMYLKHWDEAADLLELLIESEPDAVLYINSLGKVMWEIGRYERAVDLFARVYEKNPTDQTALAGLVEGLTKLDRKNEALPYLEQLTLQQPTNTGVRRYLAFLLYETGNYEKARAHFTILSRNEDVEFEVLYKTARTYEHLGLERQAATYWERVLTRRPENIEAHLFLAGHYEKTGQADRSLAHLQAILAQRPDDIALYLRLGKAYDNAGEYDNALSYYGRYLAAYPGDDEIGQRIAALSHAVQQESQAAADLEQKPAAADEQTEKLHEAISRLEAAGRHEETVPLYRQLIGMSPEDHEILAALAHTAAAVAESGGNAAMLEFLSAIAAEDTSLYRSMAELFRQRQRQEELPAIMAEIHRLEPDDTFTTQELAILHLDRGELQLSRQYFDRLADSDCWNSRCLEARASLAGKMNLPARELKDYETLLELQRDRFDIRFAAVGLAADMGLLDTALYHAGYLQITPAGNENLELKVLLADAYRVSGYLNRAVERYRNFIERAAGENEAGISHLRIRSWLGIAESYERLGLVYEAEQTLRTALAREENRIPILEALFQLFLQTGRIAESEIWLQSMDPRLAAPQSGSRSRTDMAWKEEFLKAEMYAAAGSYGLAVVLYEEADRLLPRQEDGSMTPAAETSVAPVFLIRSHMALRLLQAGEYGAAERIVRELRNSGAGEKLELLVLLQQIYRAWGKDQEAEEAAAEASDHAARDFGRQLALVRLYREYRDVPRQLQTAETAAAQMPESLAAKQLLVAARVAQGDYVAALGLLRQFLRYFPENTLFLSRQAEMLAKTGNFREALAVADMILSESQERRDIILLEARILWEMNRWKDSVARYESVVAPPAAKMLAKRMQELAAAADRPFKENFSLEAIAAEESALQIAEIVMSPQQAVDFSANGLAANSVAASYYALYRWQERFNRELSVRRSVMRREYYHAANKLEKVIEEYGDNDFLLYDLAGLYSKLERLGDEAALYRELEAQNSNFPGLADAVQRNNLKRRPQAVVAYNILEEDGWDGYKAVRQEIFRGSGSYYQTTNQQWRVDAARINYESTRDDRNIRSWRTMLTYDAKLSQAWGLALAGGFEKLDSGHDDTLLLSGAVTGKLADEMRAVFTAKQETVTDTIASLQRNIIQQDYKLELMFDLFPRLILGGYYDFIDYSDENWTSNYTFWASYIFLPEPTLFEIKYHYDFYDSSEGQMPGIASDDGFAPDDHPYWSPKDYWITRFSFNIRHQLSNDALARGVPSYYTIEYSVGYDSNDNDLHELRGSLTVEIAENYLLSASYGYLDLDVYQEKEALLSVLYRF